MTLGFVEIPQPTAAVFPLMPLLAQAGSAGGRDGAAQALPPLLPPVLLLALCIAAGVGTYFLLPGGRRGPGVRGVGAVILAFAVLVLALVAVRSAALHFGGVGGPGVYFWVFSAIALFAALRVITHPRPVYAALYFVLTVFATAGLFVLMWAEFMAAALVLIYAGAILVTYVFVIMLASSTARSGLDKVAEYDAVSRDPLVASAVGFALMGVLLFVVFDRAARLAPGPRSYTYTAVKVTPGGREIPVSGEVTAPSPAAAQAAIPPELIRDESRLPVPAFTTQSLGRYLFRDQAVNLELAGVILTLGMVGAILIARRRVITPDAAAIAAAAGQASFTAPATPISDDPFSIPVYGTHNPSQKAYPET